MPDPEQSSAPDSSSAPRPFWSGTLTFGLVNVPVRLHSGVRSAGPSLRMVDADGTPLERRYYCPEHDAEVPRSELVRGYEVDEGRFVVVSKEEMDSLAPERTREIDVRRFVPVGEIDPIFFERPYVIMPDEGPTKAYLLLVETMERTGRAGLATVVIRSKEHLVAILARDGVLWAQTMRFDQETRDAEGVGLPEPDTGDPALRDAMVNAMRTIEHPQLDLDELRDPYPESLESLAADKRAAGAVVSPPAGARTAEGPATQIIDLVAALRKSLGQAAEPDDLSQRTRAELYDRARALDLPGRSSMNKGELLEALRAHHPRGGGG